jgi:hypothetical protein
MIELLLAAFIAISILMSVYTVWNNRRIFKILKDVRYRQEEAIELEFARNNPNTTTITRNGVYGKSAYPVSLIDHPANNCPTCNGPRMLLYNGMPWCEICESEVK